MTTPLLVLFVEDSEDDVLLLTRELRRGGFDPTAECVETAAAFRAALGRRDWQVIISDYMMPAFTGLAALALLKDSGRDVPFVLVSGTVGEDVAVESIKAGATDYLMKHNLLRLVPAVTAALREAKERRKRREAEEALRRSQELLSLIYDNAADCLSLYTRGADDVWRLTSVNRTYLNTASRRGLALDEHDLLGKTVEEVVADRLRCGPAAAAAALEQFRAVARSGRPHVEEQTLDLPAGRFFVEVTVVPVRDGSGACRHVLLASKDVSERKKAEEKRRHLEARLLQAQKLEALGTLAGSIAHDFNNVLTGIIGYADLIRMAAADPSLQAHAREILRAGQRAREMIRQILAFSRRQPPVRLPLRFEEVAHEVRKLLEANLPPGVALGFDLAPDGPTLLADASQVHQLLMNLCTNALQAMGAAGGRLTVALAPAPVDAGFARAHPPLRAGPHALLTVGDTGPGMDAETLEHIFDPFFTTKPLGVGTGLGLAVVHGIVRAHEGAVLVESRPDRGTTFRVYFPTTAGAASAAEAPAADLARGSGQEVMFVDDDLGVAQLAAALLTRLGYFPTTFTDPAAALSAFRAAPGRFALVVTDLNMPQFSGIDLARQVREARRDVPIVLTTGFGGGLDDAGARGLGFRELLGKPFTIQTLSEVIHRVLTGASRNDLPV